MSPSGKITPVCAPAIPPDPRAALRNLAIRLLRRLEVTDIAAMRRYFAARPAEALEALGLHPLSVVPFAAHRRCA